MQSRLFLIMALAASPALAHSALKSYLAANRACAAQVGGYDQSWAEDGAYGASHYHRFFSDVLSGKSFLDVLADRKRAGKRTHVADFFGSCLFVPSHPSIDSRTGIRLRPLAPSERAANWDTTRWEELSGDLLDRRTWTALDARRAARQIPSFDLIVVRPLGAYQSLQVTSDEGLVAMLGMLRRAYARLSDDDGVIYFQLPPARPGDRSERLIAQWLEELTDQGFDVTSATGFFGKWVARLTRHQRSPKAIPEVLSITREYPALVAEPSY